MYRELEVPTSVQAGDRVRVAAFLQGHRENGLEVGTTGTVVDLSAATGSPVVEFDGWQNGHDADHGDGVANRWFIFPDCIAVDRVVA